MSARRARLLTACVAVACAAVSARADEARPLREIAAAKGIGIGAAIDTWILDKPDWQEVLVRHFNLAAVENSLKFGPLSPARGQYNFATADRVVDFARQHGLAVHGHVLVWHVQTPDWLEEGNFSKEEMKDILRDHIFTVMNHYKGRISEWDVVNEAFNEDGTLRETVWLKAIGPEYIELAFRWAAEANPVAKLFYNDFNIEWENPKSDAVLKMLKDLKKKNVRIDGVGFQSHLTLKSPPDFQNVRRNVRRFARAGFPVLVTELDVQVPAPADARKREAEAQLVGDYLEAVLDDGKTKSVTFWGLSDAISWIPSWFPGNVPGLLFDEQLNPKPSFDAVAKALEKADSVR